MQAPESRSLATAASSGTFSATAAVQRARICHAAVGRRPDSRASKRRCSRSGRSFVRVFFDTTQWTFGSHGLVVRTVELAQRVGPEYEHPCCRKRLRIRHGEHVASRTCSPTCWTGRRASTLFWVTLFNEPNSTRLPLRNTSRSTDGSTATRVRRGLRDRVASWAATLLGPTTSIGESRSTGSSTWPTT